MACFNPRLDSFSYLSIFGDIAPGYYCGDDASLWLEKVLKKKARLLYHSNIPSPRNTKKHVEEFPLVNGNENVSEHSYFQFLTFTKIRYGYNLYSGPGSTCLCYFDFWPYVILEQQFIALVEHGIA